MATGALRKSERKVRWPYLGASQKALLVAALAAFAGIALPWGILFGQLRWGASLAVTWTLWAALMILAGASVPHPRLAPASSLIGGAIATFFGCWQAIEILDGMLSLAGVAGLGSAAVNVIPVPGLVLLISGGLIAVRHSIKLLKVPAAV
jgi:small-conductance mechanosensitive channel